MLLWLLGLSEIKAIMIIFLQSNTFTVLMGARDRAILMATKSFYFD